MTDPEVLPAALAFGRLDFTNPSVLRRAAPAVADGVAVLDVGPGVRVHRPADAGGALPVVVWCHAGGFCIGSAADDDRLCARLATGADAIVVAVDYRLAPEHPYPAALDDGYTVLTWLASGGLPGADPARIAVAGASAGGGLAAGLALLARDSGGPALAFQLLTQPVLDDRLGTASMRAGAGAAVFSRADAETCWAHYLRGLRGAPVPVYAAPLRATDLAGVAPAYVLAAGLDCLRDEAIAYALAMQRDGVPVELHVVPGVPHGFGAVAPKARVSRAAVAEYVSVLRAALHRGEPT
ncbi:alpha/beta hydrolase [Dactylosporangium sucinum]|uniref:Esterase n=1 Tax=Dactylosporangium sucinum TaxID=1424081 RepID=A0A917X311_9ACTN|nr:alpha/beta hydrolase [Dactylosporangium sucinum]GGM58845.1 esterase [Dactylosporangium sucinum]